MKNHYSLKHNNECYTPAYAVEPLLEFMKPFFGKTIWCPFDTKNSEYVKVFKDYGFKVVHSHIEDGKNFMTYEPENWDILISNPPFQNKRETFERCLSFGKPFALLMTILWLNDKAPKQVFFEKDLQLLMFDERIEYTNISREKINFSSAYYCWNFLPKQIIMRSLKENKDQLKLKIGDK